MQGKMASKAELTRWIGDWIVKELKLPADKLEGAKTFVRYGMDSVRAMMLVGDLEDHLGRRLPPTLAWDHPTIDALATHLAQAPAAAAAAASAGKRDVLAMVDLMSDEEVDALLKKELEDSGRK